MVKVIKSNELQMEVLKHEVGISADFLIDQEQRLVKANETINELIKKLMKIEEQLAQRLQLTQ
jgi:hypothetical protein